MDYLKPIFVYRGFHGKDHDHTVTRLGVATYTDSAKVAAVYATNPSHNEDQADLPRITVARLSPKKPYVLGDPEMEDVATWKQLRETLRLTETERDELVGVGWRADGDWTTTLPGKWPDDEVYTDTYRLADSPAFMEMVKSRGYDTLIMRGTFTSDDMLGDFPELEVGSYRDDDYSAIEWRPLKDNVLQEVGTFPVEPGLAASLRRITQPPLGTVTDMSVRLRDLDLEEHIQDDIGRQTLDECRLLHRLFAEDLNKLHDRSGKTLRKSFETADLGSRKLVSEYEKIKLGEEIILLEGDQVLDGYHRAMAALKSGQPIYAVDLETESPTPSSVLVVVHPGFDMSHILDKEKADKTSAATARKILKWIDTHPHVPVSVIMAPEAGAYSQKTQDLFNRIRERASQEVPGSASPDEAAQAVWDNHRGKGVVLAGFYRERCVKDIARILPASRIEPGLTMREPANIYR